jgi:hypothetical protein
MTKCLSFSFCSCILEVVSYLVSLFKSFLCVSCLSVLVYLYLCVEVEVDWRLIKSAERKESRNNILPCSSEDVRAQCESEFERDDTNSPRRFLLPTRAASDEVIGISFSLFY